MTILWVALWIPLLAQLIAAFFWSRIVRFITKERFKNPAANWAVKLLFWVPVVVVLATPLVFLVRKYGIDLCKLIGHQPWWTDALLLLVLLAVVAVVIFSPKIRGFIRAGGRIGSKVGSYMAVLLLILGPLALIGIKVGKAAVVDEQAESWTAQLDPVQNGFIDVRGQIHVHCYLSHDSRGTLEEITQAAAKDGVRWIIFTDHLGKLPPGNYPDQMNGVLLIYGCERNYEEHTSVFRASLKDPEETLFLHGHVESFSASADSKWFYQKEDGDPVIRWDALEAVNFHANALDHKLGILGSIFFYPESLYNNITCLIPKNFDYWQKLAEHEGRPIPIFGAPDAHQNIKILGVYADPYELILGLISTHIWVEAGAALDQKTIFDAIKKGRTYVAFDYLGDPTGFKFFAEKMNGDRCMTGEAMLMPKYLSVWAPAPDSEVVTKFYCDNVLVGEIVGSTTYMPNPKPGFWRVELWRNGRPWIISGQILVI